MKRQSATPPTIAQRTRTLVDIILLWGLLAGAASVAHAQSAIPTEGDSSSGKAKLKKFDWSMYFQVRYTGIDDAEDLYALRRFKLMLNGYLSEHVLYFAQGLFKDGNKSDTDGRAYFQEGWVKLTHQKYAQMTIGQFKPPFGMERFTSDAEILTIDRSQATDRLIPNGGLGDSFARDRGIQLDGRVERGSLHYALGMFDGQGANHQFHGIGPLFATRVRYEVVRHHQLAGHPLNLRFGGALSTRRALDIDLSQCCPGQGLALQHFSGRDNRFNLELAGDWGGSSLRAEYFQTHFDFRDPTGTDFTADGLYVQGAHSLTRKFQAVVKFEAFDPDRLAVNNKDIRWTTVGLNYYIKGDRAKAMVNYVLKRERANSINNDALMLQFQLYLK
jgi:phosphate-selective porin OprO and OprP